MSAGFHPTREQWHKRSKGAPPSFLYDPDVCSSAFPNRASFSYLGNSLRSGISFPLLREREGDVPARRRVWKRSKNARPRSSWSRVRIPALRGPGLIVRLDDPLSCHCATRATPRQLHRKASISVYNAEGGNRTLTPEGTRF